MATDSQGNTFVFAGSTYTVTSVTVTPGGDLLDQSHLGQASGSNRIYQAPALKDDEVSAEAFGTTALAVGASGVLSFASVTYTATVSSSKRGVLGRRVGEASVTFKVKS
jgi:hypothetical protein